LCAPREYPLTQLFRIEMFLDETLAFFGGLILAPKILFYRLDVIQVVEDGAIDFAERK